MNQIEKIADAAGGKTNLKGPLPKTWGALYVNPNPDGSKKNCSNCVAGNELILVNNAPRSISREPSGYVLSESGQAEIGGWLPNGKKEVVRVRTSHGLQVRVTPNHKIYTENRGWAEAADLKKGDIVNSICSPSLSSMDAISRDEAMLMGAWTGDGWLQERGVGFGWRKSMSEAWSPVLSAGRRIFGSKEKPSIRTPSKRSNGLCTQKEDFFVVQWRTKQARQWSISKNHIDDRIWNSSLECAGAYLKGLFTADGSIGSRKDPRYNSHTISVVFCNTNKMLVDEVRLLLRRMGIYSTTHVHIRNEYKDLHWVAISRRESLIRYAEWIGFLDKRRNDILHEGIALRDRGRKGPEVIRSVSWDGKEDVFDISVPKTRSFYASGLLVHNCMMWISKDQQCEIHAENIMVTKDHDCGYHVFGKPHPKRMHKADGVHLDPVDPKHSGLAKVPGGSVCGNCEYYKKKDAKSGICQVVQIGVGESGSIGKLAPVEAMGCCARWEAK